MKTGRPNDEARSETGEARPSRSTMTRPDPMGRGRQGAARGRRAGGPRRLHPPGPRAGRAAAPAPADDRDDGRPGPIARPGAFPVARPRRRPRSSAPARWAITGSARRSAAAAWASSTRPSRSRSAAASRSRSCRSPRRWTPGSSSGSRTSRWRRPTCTTPTSCRCTPSAASGACTTTPCSSSTASRWPP